MKKLRLALLTGIVIMSLAGCGAKNSDDMSQVELPVSDTAAISETQTTTGYVTEPVTTITESDTAFATTTETAETAKLTTTEKTTTTSVAETTTVAATTTKPATTTETTTTAKSATTTKPTTTKKSTTTTKATETTKKATTTTKKAEPPVNSGTYKLSNANASSEAVSLYNYICGVYGNRIISGQQESTWMGSDQYEFEYIYKASGKYPAIRGLDYMNDDFKGVNKRAKAWYQRGGIVTICWHCGSDFSGSWSESMNTTITDWDKALTEGTAEYNKLIAGMDKGAKALLELRDAGIPVLWRPFHELDGAWFWWGKGGADNFVKLWRIMYDRYTNYWQLDNLIWVLGYSGNGYNYSKWYPGDEYVDIAGADSYSVGANARLYNAVKNVVGGKPICYHECGTNPTVKQLKDSKAQWVWFMTWHTSQLTDNNSSSALKALYNDDYVITLDELPKDLYKR